MQWAVAGGLLAATSGALLDSSRAVGLLADLRVGPDCTAPGVGDLPWCVCEDAIVAADAGAGRALVNAHFRRWGDGACDALLNTRPVDCALDNGDCVLEVP